MYAGPGRQSRRIHRLGSGRPAKTVWTIKEKFPVWSGAVVTAGDVVFYGTMDGWFKAVDARTGKLLWQFKTGSGIIGQPSVSGPDGKQYVAVLSRRRRLGRRDRRRAISTPRDATAALGLVQGDGRPARWTRRKGGTLYVFALRGPNEAGWRLSLLASASRAALPVRRASPTGAAARVRRPRTTCRSRTQHGEGFENRIARAGRAAISARTLRIHLVAAAARLRAQHPGRGQVRRGDGRAGAPRSHADTTRPYYRSSYVFVAPQATGISRCARSTTQRLRRLAHRRAVDRRRFREQPPGACAGAAAASSATWSGYAVFGDYSQPNPPARIVEARGARRRRRRVRLGAAGRLLRAHRQPMPLDDHAGRAARADPDLPFTFDIAMGVRRGDDRAARPSSTTFIVRRRAGIDSDARASYGVPRSTRRRQAEDAHDDALPSCCVALRCLALPGASGSSATSSQLPARSGVGRTRCA